MKKPKPIEPCPEERTHSVKQLATFSEVGKTLTSTLNLSEILNTVMKQISELIQPKNWSLMLVDEDKKELYFEIAVGDGAEKINKMRFKIGEGIAGWVAKEGKPMLVTDVKKEPLFSRKADQRSEFKTKSIVCVPLMTKGKCHGVIELINKVEEEGSFGDEDLLLLNTLADYTAIAIENSKLFDKVQELTITDDLTHLYNSRYLHRSLEHEVERARRFKENLSLIFMDLDYFKLINDKHGHLSGSKLLVEIGGLITSTIRTIDIACRYGGDEFVVVMPETSKENAGIVAEKLRSVFKGNRFLKEEGLNCTMTASFGVASYPEDAKDRMELIHLADQAMYRVKNSTRDGVEMA